jgi:two-component system sensor histidine kinase/response regulator
MTTEFLETGRSAELPAVLAVDDRPANLLALEALFEPLKLELFKATSGREAIRLASERRFAVALVDVVMPEMDGFETVRQLRELPLSKLTPIILLTAFEFDPRQIEALQGTALVDYIGKPLPAGLLRGKVEALVSLYRFREALAAKDRDIAMLAHDLQTPLASISAGTDILLRGATDERTQNVAKRVIQTVFRMSNMVSDLTDYARVGQGPIPVKLRPVDLGAIVAQVVDECRQVERGDCIRVETSGDLNGQWDPDRLSQAITNVVMNALRYGEGDVRVRVRDAGAMVNVSVHNAGPPIPAARLATIFEAFQRATETGKGLGLGLFIVRAVVEAHGGVVDVSSSADAGTTLVLRLPRRPR